MAKIDDTVRKETLYIVIMTFLMSCVMESVYLVLHRWTAEVLLGNLLGAAAACLNFLLMGITIQRSLGKDSKAAAAQMKASQALRMLMLFVFAVVGLSLPCFDTVAVLVPLLFPRIAIALRPMLDKAKGNS